MIPSSWTCIERRLCTRGYSLALFRVLIDGAEQYAITLYLDGLPYWVYENLRKEDALPAMDDLELAPGPRGDSTWNAVLARLLLGNRGQLDLQPPQVLKITNDLPIGTWEWVQQLTANRLKPKNI